MRTLLTRRAQAVLTTLVCGLVGCGGGEPVAPAPRPAPMEPLPVLAQLVVSVSSDTLRASETGSVAVVAKDTKARDMTVGFVIWRSSDPAVLSVASDGSVAAMSPGTATVSARVGDVQGARVIVVLPPPPGPLPVASLDLTPFITELEVGRTLALTAQPRDYAGTPLTDRAVTFVTNDTAIAIVGSDGTVTARSTGIALVEASAGGRRAAAYIRVRVPLDKSLSVSVAQPLAGTVVSDSVIVTASVRAARPLATVVASISGSSVPMRLELIQKFDVVQEIWLATVDVSTLPFGALALVITATDESGAQGVAVVPLIRNTKVAGSGTGPGAVK